MTVTVVVCAYTERRWPDLVAAVESVAAQTVPVDQLLLVIDHNPALAERAVAEIPGVTVLANENRRGLSGARNTALAHATGDIVVFLDDDASAAGPDWLSSLLAPYEDPLVMAVGGAATPLWPGERPVTLPVGPGEAARGELDWVVGCTYTGQPVRLAEVRNLMGCNMSFRRKVFDEVGGFTEDMGRVGAVPVGCEETELCIRLRGHDPLARIVFEPRALVRHRVSSDRLTWSYLRRRSWGEGISKAAVSRLVGAEAALSTERAYTSRIIPAAFFRELLRLHVAGAAALVVSVLFAAAGYARGKFVRTTQELGQVSVGEWDRSTEDPPRFPYPARVLIRDGLTVIGEVMVAAGAEPDELADVPATEEERRLTPSVTVVVPSAGRPELVARCVRSVLATQYPRLEVIVVDNRPESPALRELEALDARVRYVPEPVRGLSNARNRGAAEASGEIVAFTDDDAVVDRLWLDRLVAEFADPAVDCVTGLVLPYALQTPAQQWFEQWGGFGKGFRRTRFDARGASGSDDVRTGPLYPFAAGLFGSGNSMAWRAMSYRELGGCDPLLGAGSATKSGEDLELFIRLVRSGGVLVYTPHAVVRHEHRRSFDDLIGQMRGYGNGLLPLFAVYVGRRPKELLAVARRARGGLRHLLAGDSARNRNRANDFPPELAKAELRGVLSGPFSLLRGLFTAPRRRLGLPEPLATAAVREAEVKAPTPLKLLRGGR
ncbi:glycosyltransferase [Kutzneria sp. NPDC052558]|uniref:glycosyltransferase n=1 Tax=Kutzneria sp. NPDC052558 TaxID=3364121 RepID=UPI0037CC4CEC